MSVGTTEPGTTTTTMDGAPPTSSAMSGGNKTYKKPGTKSTNKTNKQ